MDKEVCSPVILSLKSQYKSLVIRQTYHMWLHVNNSLIIRLQKKSWKTQSNQMWLDAKIIISIKNTTQITSDLSVNEMWETDKISWYLISNNISRMQYHQTQLSFNLRNAVFFLWTCIQNKLFDFISSIL